MGRVGGGGGGGGGGLLRFVVHDPGAGRWEHGGEANEGVENGGNVVVSEASNAVEKVVALLWWGDTGGRGFIAAVAGG